MRNPTDRNPMMWSDAKILIATFVLLFGTGLAIAGTGTIGVTVGSGKTYDVVTDTNGNYIGIMAIGDGTAAANYAAVKPASTAAAATDPALVVTVSPNNTVATTQSGTWTNTVTQATAGNLNATV